MSGGGGQEVTLGHQRDGDHAGRCVYVYVCVCVGGGGPGGGEGHGALPRNGTLLLLPVGRPVPGG